MTTKPACPVPVANLGRELRAGRVRLALTRREVAESIGVHAQTVAEIERTGQGRFANIAAYAALVGVSWTPPAAAPAVALADLTVIGVLDRVLDGVADEAEAAGVLGLTAAEFARLLAERRASRAPLSLTGDPHAE